MAGAPLLMLLTLAVAGCTARPPAHDRSGETHYNRRELPATPGVFSGKTGEWTASPPRQKPDGDGPTGTECPGRDPSQCDSAQRH